MWLTKKVDEFRSFDSPLLPIVRSFDQLFDFWIPWSAEHHVEYDRACEVNDGSVSIGGFCSVHMKQSDGSEYAALQVRAGSTVSGALFATLTTEPDTFVIFEIVAIDDENRAVVVAHPFARDYRNVSPQSIHLASVDMTSIPCMTSEILKYRPWAARSPNGRAWMSMLEVAR